MKVLSIVAEKGGVGKTTIAVNLALRAALTGRRTLLVDFDGQGNLTSSFLHTPEIDDAPAHTLFEDDPVKPIEIGERFFLYQADDALNDVERILDIEEGVVLPKRNFAKWTTRYDIIIIDTPPGRSVRTTAALIASDYCLVPFLVEAYSLHGISQIQNTIEGIRSNYNPRLVNLGFIPNRIKARVQVQTNSLDVLREAEGFEMFPCGLSDLSIVSELTSQGKAVWAAGKGSTTKKASEEMMALVTTVFEKMGS